MDRMNSHKLNEHLLHFSDEYEDRPVSIVVLQIDQCTAPAELLTLQDAVVRAALLFSPQTPLE